MMRTALLALLLVLAASTVPSTIARDNLVVPGQRIGPWMLGITLSQFVGTAGKPIDPRHQLETDLLGTFGDYCSVDVCGLYRVEKSLAVLKVTEIGRFSRTGKGVGVGSRQTEVLAAYGRPTGMTVLGDDFAGGFTRLIYDEIGISFRLNAITETVTSISIFRPGTAAGIWRF
jgi:hypothetical protein